MLNKMNVYEVVVYKKESVLMLTLSTSKMYGLKCQIVVLKGSSELAVSMSFEII